ncbi:hypothetical protein PV328_004050 [Microctonus aethiopoides]|uniref:Uncharacterized protein n=1 Tax=Microctonus aethiopoides TaxID=144406 RepID=A0AA39F9P7_9HYME|nr:hypothetical protein PV328_004050 [Microctonus aethiopoides]
MKKTSVACMETHNNAQALKLLKRKMSDPDIHHPISDLHSQPSASTIRSAAITIPHRSHDVTTYEHTNSELNVSKIPVINDFADNEISPPFRPVVGSAGSPSNQSIHPSTVHRPGRALINPFDPSHVTIKLTSNRRRWTHIFPKGPTGVLIQQHHYQAVPTQSRSEKPNNTSDNSAVSSSPVEGVVMTSTPIVIDSISRSTSQIGFQDRVDWKSLTIPACLPITTDYFPDKRSLQNDYVVSDYNLLPDDVNADFAQQRAIYKKPLTTAEVFRELVSQRLSQGFQLIIFPSNNENKSIGPGMNQTIHVSSVMRGRQTESEPREEYLLSIGRIFHKISLCGNCITVTRYRPRHPYPPFNIHYRYRFHAPHHDTYETSWVSFSTEKLENFNWNYLDHYICTRGDTDFALVEALKYWRFRMFLLPLNNIATRKILDGSKRCDIYTPTSEIEQSQLMEGFLRFIEGWLNKIRRPNPNKNSLRIYNDGIIDSQRHNNPRAGLAAKTASVTKDEQQLQYLLQVVREHRQKYPNCKKTTLLLNQCDMIGLVESMLEVKFNAYFVNKTNSSGVICKNQPNL